MRRPAGGEATSAVDAQGYFLHLLPKGIRIHQSAVLPQLNTEAPVEIRPGVLAEGALTVGAYSYISEGTRLSSPTTIGRYCSIAHNCDIGGTEHPTDRVTTHPFTWGRLPFDHWPAMGRGRKVPFDCSRPVVIGHDVWIGTRAFVRNGVTVGTGAVVGAHAVVVRDIPPYAVVVGNPGRIARFRFSDEVIARLLASRWWARDLTELSGLPFENVEEFLCRIEAGGGVPVAPLPPPVPVGVP